MKTQTVYHTPVGVFMSIVREETEEEAQERFAKYLGFVDKEYKTEANDDGFQVETHNGTYFIPPNVVKNSVIEFYTIEEETQ